MKKETYAETALEIIRFTTQDVILTSDTVSGEPDEVSGQAP